MEKFLSIPVTNEGNQLVSVSGIKLIDAGSATATTTTIAYAGGKVTTVTAAAQVAFTYKSLNRLIQASSADQTKMAMKLCFDHGYLPMLTVHDELCFSIKSEEDVPVIKELMENCVPDLSIPSIIDVGIGTDWGNAK